MLEMYYNKENQVTINQSLNEFYIHFFFKIDALLQEVGFLLDIAVTFFNDLIPDVRELLISEGVKVPQILPTETNHQGNQRLLLVINSAVESEKNIRTIKAAVQPAVGRLHQRTFMSMPGVRPSIKTSDLSSRFQYEINNSMVAGKMEEYALSSS